MNDWIDKFAHGTHLPPTTIVALIQTVVILSGFLIARRVCFRLVRKNVTDIKRHYNWRRGINHTGGVILVVLLAGVWFTGLQNSATMLGLLAAGLAIALQDPLANLAGWLFILTRRPYAVGDRIEIAGHRGDVIDIRLFQTFLLECGNWVDADQSTGRVLGIPNGMVFKTPSANATGSFNYIWDEVPVLVTFESNWRKAKKHLIEIANTIAQPLSTDAQDQIRRAARKQMIFFQNLTPIVYTDVRDSGVLLTIRYLTPPRQRRDSRQRIWEAILDLFDRETDLDFAYPTFRYYRHDAAKTGPGQHGADRV